MKRKLKENSLSKLEVIMEVQDDSWGLMTLRKLKAQGLAVGF